MHGIFGEEKHTEKKIISILHLNIIQRYLYIFVVEKEEKKMKNLLINAFAHKKQESTVDRFRRK